MIDYDDFEPIIINGEVTNYVINRNGIMKNIVTGYIMKPHINNKGRAHYGITHKGKQFCAPRARWLAMTFIPIPEGYTLNELEADHINGKCFDDRLENIQWLTPEENRTKSYTTDGNLFYGELNGATKLKEKTVRKIVKDLAKGKTPKELSKKYGINSATIIDIRIGRTWTHISKDYDLEKFITRRPDVQRYSLELKHEIHNILKENEGIRNRQVCDILNTKYDNKIRCLINRIRFEMYDKGSTTIENEEDNYYNIIINL